jgi:hypothetical protein
MNPTRGPANEIKRIETRSVNASTSAIMVALNMRDLATADAFVKEAVHKVLLQRMMSPPETPLLCITIMGTVTAREFADLWHKHLAEEPAMAAFLERMQAADVIHGTPEGQVLDKVSLLDGLRAPDVEESPPGPGRAGWFSSFRSLFRKG